MVGEPAAGSWSALNTDKSLRSGLQARFCIGIVSLSAACGAVRGAAHPAPAPTSGFTAARHGWYCGEVRELRAPDGIQPAGGGPEMGRCASIPRRPEQAAGGAVVLAKLANLPVRERERALSTEFLSGNVPEACRRFVTVESRTRDANGRERRVRYEVMADYLSLGGNADWVRVPLTPMTAQRLATAWGCSLPTRKIVDDLYQQAQTRLEPIPLTEERESVTAFLEHHRRIEAQRGKGRAGGLTVGAKKDVVLTNRLLEKRNRVAIYGWHRPDGRPIQPLTIVHHSGYVDYSHGVRLVKQCVWVDGEHHRLEALLRDPVLAPLVSDEGPLRITVYPGDWP